MNSYPPTMMVPEYVKTGKDEGTVGKKTILTDYVGTRYLRENLYIGT